MAQPRPSETRKQQTTQTLDSKTFMVLPLHHGLSAGGRRDGAEAKMALAPRKHGPHQEVVNVKPRYPDRTIRMWWVGAKCFSDLAEKYVTGDKCFQESMLIDHRNKVGGASAAGFMTRWVLACQLETPTWKRSIPLLDGKSSRTNADEVFGRDTSPSRGCYFPVTAFRPVR